MKKSLIALAFGTFALGMAEFVMMSILPYVAQSMQCSIPEAGHLISAYAIGVCVGAPSVVLVARKRPLHQILLGLIVIYLTGNLLMASCSDLHLGVHLRFAAWGVFRCRLHRSRPAGSSRQEYLGHRHHVLGHDRGQPHRHPGRNVVERHGFLARDFPVQRSMGHPHLHPALPSGSANGTSSEHRAERTVPLPEKCGPLAHHGYDHFREWRYLLLVQLYQPAHEPDCGIRPFRDHHAYGIGRRQHVRGKPVGRQASRPLYAGQNHIGRTGDHDFRTAHHFFPRVLSRHCRTDAVHLHGLPLRSVRTAATAAVAFFQRWGNDGSGFGTGCLQFR